MKKILFVLLLSISSVVHAQWTFIDESSDSKVSFFYDKSSVQQINQYKRAWFKMEYSETSKMAIHMNVRSVRLLEEYDCRERKIRELSYTTFKQSNLIDVDLINNKVSEWRFIAPDTINEMKLTVLCKSK